MALARSWPQVSTKCRFESQTLAGMADDVTSATSDNSNTESSAKDLVLGTKPEKDALIGELQAQIRKQLAKVGWCCACSSNVPELLVMKL